jgi:chromosome partitioning protein
MRKIAFINEKGGTGKTTLAVNVAASFALHQGKKVALVDLDTQGHAAKALGVDSREAVPNVFHWLTDPRVTVDQVLKPTTLESLFVVPSYKQMADFPLAVGSTSAEARERLLAGRMSELRSRGFEVVVFDSPPSLGLTSTNILMAADEVVVPVALTYFSLDGCAEVVSTVAATAKTRGRPELRVTQVVPTLYRKTALAEAILGKLREYFPGNACGTPLSFNVRIDEAQSHGQTIWEYSAKSSGAKMLRQIADEIWEAGELSERVVSRAG